MNNFVLVIILPPSWQVSYILIGYTLVVHVSEAAAPPASPQTRRILDRLRSFLISRFVEWSVDELFELILWVLVSVVREMFL